MPANQNKQVHIALNDENWVITGPTPEEIEQDNLVNLIDGGLLLVIEARDQTSMKTRAEIEERTRHYQELIKHGDGGDIFLQESNTTFLLTFHIPLITK